ncbi:pyruvate kinase [Halobaculum sp. CBA1158]|uniref:pyruvate kinase n=1 Tax=Halobaculum sp. CBA1158 TaxID=2904243 RepID=UPI001F01D7A7|nr:pyruvate kinase [Halobaculum sp. CBA1158]UIP01239.1 pyruvate kinase [Halobaculum sp. CBA1158]
MRRAKIVCTLGPASDDRGTIRALADAGMSVARLNASHGDTAHRGEVIDRIRAVDNATAEPLAAMLDLQGPEVRTAELDAPIDVATDSEVRFVEGDDATPAEIGVNNGLSAAAPGDRVLLDDGRIETTVIRVGDEGVVARVDSGGELGSRKGVNVPGVDLGLPTITERDERELDLAADHDVDFVAASFIGDAGDVYAVADALEERGAGDVPVVAKIERADAVENLAGIVDAAYGVMVARGDLGVECPLEDVPMIQKRIIRKCVETGTPVITATEMLDSMVRSRRPTRAEASDVANAVLDGTDAVMLSGETAIGDHPVRVVETMDRIVQQVETSAEYAETREERVPLAETGSRTEPLARSARFLARDTDAAAIVAASESGYTARKTAKFRPGVPIVSTTPSNRVRRQLALSWGVRPMYADYSASIEEVMDSAVTAALEAGAAESGDTLVVLSGMMTELEGTNTTNTLKLHVAAETVATGRHVVGGRAVGPLARVPDGDLSAFPDGGIAYLPPGFDAEFVGDTDRLAGVVDARSGMTGYPALVAREVGVPMISGATLSSAVADDTVVTVDGERGVVYEGDVIGHGRRQ